MPTKIATRFLTLGGLCLLAVTSSLSPGISRANLLINGSFEENPGTINPSIGYRITTNLYGWQVVLANVDLIANYWQASDGLYSLDLTGTGSSHAKIQQSFATIPSRQYLVQFDMAANPFLAGVAPQSLEIAAGGSSSIFSFDPQGKTLANMGWTEMWWVFEAISTTSTLSFQSLSSGGAHGPALDNVRVTLVPEFSTGYFGIIAVLFGFLMRRHLR